jgi:AcrR family transcriptional regulator
MADAAPQQPAQTALTRRERRKLEVRNRILEAAEHSFEAAGVASATIADICARADVAHKTFFNHFPSKQHLLDEIAEQFLDRFLTKIAEARAQRGSTQHKLAYLFDQVASEAEAAGPMHRELVTEIIHVAHESGSDSEQARKLHGAFGDLIAEGIAAGDVTRAHPAETLTEVVLGAYYVLIFDWALLADYPLRERARAAATFLGDAMTAKH